MNRILPQTTPPDEDNPRQPPPFPTGRGALVGLTIAGLAVIALIVVMSIAAGGDAGDGAATSDAPAPVSDENSQAAIIEE